MDKNETKNRSYASREPAVRPKHRAESDEDNLHAESERRRHSKKKKKKATINMVVYILAALLIVFAGVLLIREFVYFPSQPNSTPFPTVNPSEVYATQVLTPLATPVDDYEMIPVKFHFVDREITCDIYPVGIDENNGMAARASASDVSWLSISPYVVPGDVGNAVIAGHNLWKGEAGTFSTLKKVAVGEVVAISFDKGFSRYFEVTETYVCSYDDTRPMRTQSDESVLTLITCMGDWNSSLDMSNSRMVVVCKPKL